MGLPDSKIYLCPSELRPPPLAVREGRPDMHLLLLLLGIQLLAGSAADDNCTESYFVDIRDAKLSSSNECNQATGAGWKGVLKDYAKEDHRQFVVPLKLSGQPYLVQRPDCVSEIKFYVDEVLVKSVVSDVKNKNSITLKMPGERCKKKNFTLKIMVLSLEYSKVKEKCHEASQKITYENFPDDCNKVIQEIPSEPRQRPNHHSRTNPATPTTPTTSTTPESNTTHNISKIPSTIKDVSKTDQHERTGREFIHSENNLPTVENTSTSQVPLIAGAAGGGLLLVIGVIALGVWLYKKRKSAAEAEEMEMNTDINDVYGTYGECGEGDYNIVEDNNPYYEAGD